MARLIRYAKIVLLIAAAASLPAKQGSAIWPYDIGADDNAATLAAPAAVVFADSGDVYVAGRFDVTLALDGMPPLNSAGAADIFVVKLDSDGNLLWVRTAGGGAQDAVSAMALDGDGNVYLTGSFCRPPAGPQDCSATFGNLGAVSVPGGTGNDYVARLNSDGTWAWVREVATDSGDALLTSISVDGGEVFVGGWFRGTMTALSGGGFQRVSAAPDRRDAVLAKLTTAGAWLASSSWRPPNEGQLDFRVTSMVKQGDRVVAVLLPSVDRANPGTASPSRGPLYELPDGGNCTVSGRPSAGAGATVTCTNVALSAYADVYYGIKNDTATIASSMTGAVTAPNIFRYQSATSSSIVYQSSTSITDVRFPLLGGGVQAVTSQLNLARVSGALSPVGSGIVASNGNGDTERLFRVGSTEFTVRVQAYAMTPVRTGFAGADNHVFDVVHTAPDAGNKSISSVDLAFYYQAKSVLLVASANDLSVLAPDGVDLGYAADTIAADEVNGLAVAGFLPSGKSVAYGADTISGPALAVAHFTLGDQVPTQVRDWAAPASGASYSAALTFGDGVLYATAAYEGVLFLENTDVLTNITVEPMAAGTDSDVLVAAIETELGDWNWATRVGGASTDIVPAIDTYQPPTPPDEAMPFPEVLVAGNYTAPAAFGTFDFDDCEKTCTVVDQQQQPSQQPCNAVNEQELCLIDSCDLPILCVDGEVPPATTGFAMKLQDEGQDDNWLLPVERWVVGREVPRPDGAAAGLRPTISIEGIENSAEANQYFFWSVFEGKLYAARPSELPATIGWRIGLGQTGTIDVDGVVRWPDNPQIHMANAPVDLDLSGDRCPVDSSVPFAACVRDEDCGAGHACDPLDDDSIWTFGQILYKDGDSDVTINPATKVFNASAGRATLLFINSDNQNPDDSPVALVPVRTLSPELLVSGQPTACTIGTEIVNPDHQDPNGKNGWIVHERAFYDGVGADAAYRRDDSRAGSILPVNMEDPGVANDEMLIAWYRQDERGIAWPQRPILYDCQWPTDADKVVIVSTYGSDGRCVEKRGFCQVDEDCPQADGGEQGTCIQQPPLNPAVYPGMKIYSQSDPTLPGFNPNEEHALLFGSNAGTGFNAVYALRTDLNVSEGHSEPFVLLKYSDPATQRPAMRVYEVVMTDGVYTESFAKTAGQLLSAPYPISELQGESDDTRSGACTTSCAPLDIDCSGATGPECVGSVCVGGSLAGETCTAASDCVSSCLQSGATDALCSGEANHPLFKDHLAIGADGTWKGWWARSPGIINARYDYPIQPDFFVDFDLDGAPDRAPGSCEPWLVDGDTQRSITYDITWPENVPVLRIGETLVEPKGGSELPSISLQARAEVVFETTQASSAPQNEPTSLVRLVDPLNARSVPLDDLPDDVVSVRRGLVSRITGGDSGNIKLTPVVSARITYDQNTEMLSYTGVYDESGLGDPFLLLNVMTARERDELKTLSSDGRWDDAIDALYALSRNPNGVDADLDGTADDALQIGLTMEGSKVVPEKLLGSTLGSKALTAGLADSTGYVTVAFNNDPTLAPLVTSLAVLKVDCAPYQGQVNIIPSANIFDEQVTLRHSGDFAGDADSMEFEWYLAVKEGDCQSIPVQQYPGGVQAPWTQLAAGPGIIDVTLSGPGVTSLADTCVIARYRGYSVCDNQLPDGVPSQWAGAPLGTNSAVDPRAQLVPGWLTRVTDGLNPFDQRTADFRTNEVDTLANLLVSAGERFEGPIAFNPDADALNSVGLIEIYETVLKRAEDLSINADISVGAVNSKLLDVAARISDLYMAFGNEAFGDALDPTIGFDTSGQFGTAATSIFAFQDQADSLLTEELGLLRGRDECAICSPPVYNRLIWNFTGRDGQVAYQQNYNITNQDGDADIDEFDARVLYPQGHGDAWGHYLTAIKGYYMLLRHPNFTWLPRSDSVAVAGAEILVDFTDERRFAAAAAARARAGSQIVDLTYRQRWVDDPAGQFQGYKDTDSDRAFGVSGWAHRAGQGAFFDWVVANAIVPPQSDAPPGIQKIDRTTIPELREIATESSQVQAQLDLVDRGVNPLGIAKNAVPFDINPEFLDPGIRSQTHYEQVAGRANQTLANAVLVFDHANGLTQLLRRNQDTQTDFARNVAGQERDFNNRLIEIFGTPYPEDIGPGRTYKAGYEGPDVWNYDLVDPSELTGLLPGAAQDVSTYTLEVPSPDWEACSSSEDTCRFDSSGKLKYDSNGNIVTSMTTTTFRLSNRGLGKIKNPSWSSRVSPGQVQLAMSDFLQARAKLERATLSYSKLIGDIECVLGTIKAQNRLAGDRLSILDGIQNRNLGINVAILAAKTVELGLRRTSTTMKQVVESANEAIPSVVGLATDAFSAVRGAGLASVVGVSTGLETGADAAAIAQLSLSQGASIQAQIDQLELRGIEDDFQIFNLLGTLGEKLRQEPILRTEALTLAEHARQSQAKLQATIARGVRVIDQLEAFRKKTASVTAESRYSDMAFRIFRNDALQKYRAQFELAARYVYLAATAYDYETNLLGSDVRSGRRFLTDIVKQRSIGEFVGGQPVAGTTGLGGVLSQMNANFGVLKGQLGFAAPQTETTQFRLRRELFRILDTSDDTWRSTLAAHRVDNLWDNEAFRQFARPPREEDDGPLPGIFIPIPTTVTFGLNFFGWPLAGDDSAYDPTNFATKVRSVGVWFGEYGGLGLSNTPRVYLIPTGADVLRSPDANNFTTRNWTVLDQRIPVPFEIGDSQLNDSGWSPERDSLSEPLGGVRQFSSFRAYPDTGFTDSQVSTESRAIGRSVWNTRWALIITGGTLLSNADEGLNTLIYGRPLSSGPILDPEGVPRDGNGISDILLFFQTYAYSGN